MSNASRTSLATLPGRAFREPEFACASARFAEAVCGALITAADKARPEWIEAAHKYADDWPLFDPETVYQRPNLFSHPLVREFVRAWLDALQWQPVQLYSDGVQLVVPEWIARPMLNANDGTPPVKSVVLRKRGALRGIRLISYDSLMGYLNELA